MYSVSRRLVTFHSGSSLRQQTCLVENGIKLLTVTVSGSEVGGKIQSNGKRFLSSSGVSSDSYKVGPKGTNLTLSRPFNPKANGFMNIKYVSSQRHHRCYSRSAEKAAAKEEGAILGEEQQPETSSIVDDHQEEEDLDRYDVDVEEEGLHLTDEQIQTLTNGDEELIKKIKYIQLEYSVMKQDGERVPSFIKFKYWKELLPLKSKNQRKKFYLYLFKTEMKELSHVRKKQEKREERLKMYAENPLPSKEEDIYSTFYGLARNTLFLRLYDTTVNNLYHCRAARAMMHHPPLVIDCSYDEYMTHREAKNCAKQLELVITDNRTHAEPFNLYLCNAWRETKTVDFLNRCIPTLHDDDFAINFCEESYLDLFPKNRLVYLTPHTRDELEEYNEDDIYIIGAMVDKTDSRPYSFAKAKKLNLTMKRLPLDKHLMWGLGGKSLTLNQMVKIMLDLRYTRGDWKAALRHVPMRKLCREFHPYPNQMESQNEFETGPSAVMSQRNERKSFVMQDFELLNRRKGFRRSDTFSSGNRRSSQAVQAPRIKSLYDED